MADREKSKFQTILEKEKFPTINYREMDARD